MAGKVYGIDYGATYSCIARIDENGKAVIINNIEGKATTPSVVFFEAADSVIVGDAAKTSAKIYPDRTFAFIKRQMGSRNVYKAFGREYGPEALSSLIIRKLVADASDMIGEEITDVVIACPAYFGVNEREATRYAAVLAGLNVRHILNEPTAAVFGYGLALVGDGDVVLVYDLGGSTFDITIIEIRNETINLIYTDGSQNLGGKDWDDRMVNYLAAEFNAQHPESGDPRDDPWSYQSLVNDSEAIIHALTSRTKYVATISHAGRRARVEVTRETLEDITRDLLDRTIEITKTALQEGSRRLGHAVRVTKILLVGGSSRMPAVACRLEEAIALKPDVFEPDLVVAQGAALFGLKLVAGDVVRERIAAADIGNDVGSDSLLAEIVEASAMKVTGSQLRLSDEELAGFAGGKRVSVTSKGLGIVCTRPDRPKVRYAHFLIHANTPLPAEVKQTFGTLVPNQQSILFQLLEQTSLLESEDLTENFISTTAEITGLPSNLAAGSPVEVTFQLDESGTLSMSAVAAGKVINLQTKLSDGFLSVKPGEILAAPPCIGPGSPYPIQAEPEPPLVSRSPLQADILQMNVVYPRSATPGKSFSLLAYVNIPDALPLIVKDSEFLLGPTVQSSYERTGASTKKPIERGAEILVVPDLPSCICSPFQSSVRWTNYWQRLAFQVTLKPEHPLKTDVLGVVSFYVGPILLGALSVRIRVADPVMCQPRNELISNVLATIDAYQRIFVSYSHRDSVIVQQLEKAYSVLGLEYLMDVRKLRSGLQWSPALLHMIDQADIFQLCWSKAASRSPHVEHEWRHALTQQKASFVRPTYWQKPMPPPPPELASMHFSYMDLGFFWKLRNAFSWRPR